MIVHATSQDGLWSVIEAVDFPGGIGRSRTAKTPGDALKRNYEPALVTVPGPGSLFGHYVMVRTIDIAAQISPGGVIPVSAKSYLPGPNIGMGKKYIPPYPHKCLVCGQDEVVLDLFSSVEHKGICPGRKVRTLS